VAQMIGAIFLLAMDTGYPSARAAQWLLGVASIVSAVVRWRQAGRESFRYAAR